MQAKNAHKIFKINNSIDIICSGLLDFSKKIVYYYNYLLICNDLEEIRKNRFLARQIGRGRSARSKVSYLTSKQRSKSIFKLGHFGPGHIGLAIKYFYSLHDNIQI